MGTRLGNVILWICWIIAGLWIWASYGTSPAIFNYALAGVVVLFGLACRYVLTPR